MATSSSERGSGTPDSFMRSHGQTFFNVYTENESILNRIDFLKICTVDIVRYVYIV